METVEYIEYTDEDEPHINIDETRMVVGASEGSYYMNQGSLKQIKSKEKVIHSIFGRH